MRMVRVRLTASSLARAFTAARSAAFCARMCSLVMAWRDSAAYCSCIVCPFLVLKLMVIWLTRKLSESTCPASGTSATGVRRASWFAQQCAISSVLH